MTRHQRWLSFGIVALAFAVRVWMLDFKPPHFDEGVNGSMVDGMRETGYYRYDPANYHGPLHFYVLFAVQALFGREVWALRLPTVLIGTAAVALLFAFRRWLPFRAVAYAAVFLAISPAMVFYSRYAIHEMWLPFFALLGLHGGIALARGEARKSDLWRFGAGLTGMILTKETWLLHTTAAALALGTTWLVSQIMATSKSARARRPAEMFAGAERDEEAALNSGWTAGDAAQVALVCYGVLLTFYSGFGFDWGAVRGMITTFEPMSVKGTTGEEGHNKEFFYFAKLLGHYEWPALAGILAALLLALPRSLLIGAIATLIGIGGAVGLIFIRENAPGAAMVEDHIQPFLGFDTRTSLCVAVGIIGMCMCFAWPARDRITRTLALYTLASLAGYSLIPYKTPWCIVNVVAPACLVLGIALDRLSIATHSVLVGLIAALLAFPSARKTGKLNFVNPTRDGHGEVAAVTLAKRLVSLGTPVKPEKRIDGDRYTYVQTTRDIYKLLDPVRALVASDVRHRRMRGHVIGDAFPLIWLLGDFPRVAYHAENVDLQLPDADFLIVPDRRAPDIEAELRDVYFKQSYEPRGGADLCWLYLRASRFEDVLPGRKPNFRPQRPHQLQPE